MILGVVRQAGNPGGDQAPGGIGEVAEAAEVIVGADNAGQV